MSDTHEPWIAREKWIIPSSHASRSIGMSTDKQQDKDEYAQVFAIAHKDRHGRHDENDISRRIVACVNACAGIPIETLESAGKTISTQQSLNGYVEMKSQRDELLAALKAVLRISDEAGEDDEYSQEWQDAIAIMRAAIAKAEDE